jgi:hypothetical protein
MEALALWNIVRSTWMKMEDQKLVADQATYVDVNEFSDDVAFCRDLSEFGRHWLDTARQVPNINSTGTASRFVEDALK